MSGDVHFEKVRLSLPSPPLVGNFAGFELYKRIEQGPVLNTITVDGDFSDWAAVKELTRHPMPPEDQAYLQKAWITHNETHFFARIRAAESYWDSQVQILIDVDSNASTGYARRGLFIGADYRINIDFFGVVLGRYNVSYDMADAEFYSLWTVFAEANVIMGDDGSALNGVEIAVPLALLNYTGLPDVFGCDVFFKVSLDTFPTVGYARGTPYKVMYGFHKVSEDLLPSRSTFVDKDVVGAVTYEYVVVAVEKTGKKYVWDRITLYVPYAHARDFNAWVTSTTSFAMNWTYPEDTDVAWVRVVRNEDWFPDNYTDGVTIYEGMGTNYWEKDMVPGKKYYWAIFSTDGLGNWSKSWWDCEDHSVATVIHGPLPVLNTSDYTVYFSAWDAKLVRMAEKYDMVILHPGAGSALITADQVRDIKDGLDNVLGTEDDVIVIGYISVGEDYGQPNPLTPGFNDPRTNLGSMNDGRGPLWYDWKTGQRHYENKGQPSFYLDMYRYAYNDRGMRYGAAGQDDFPDQNTEWGGLYVDPGNTDWWQFLRSCTYETYGAAGFDYILKTLKMDGVFLDTVGVSAPWSYWDPPSYLGDYFWVRDGALDLMANIALWYPGAYIIPNRPMHFCYPEFAAKRYDDFRTVVNGIYWESYSADMEFWWRGNNGRIFEKVVIAGQDNHDGRGFTTIILDYFAVMIQAVETGEYELSPWYERTSDQARRTEPLNYITHVSPSRSLAEVDDYIYLYHHPEHFGGLPDWHVMYIIAPRYGAEAKAVKWPTYRDSTGARTRCNITIAVTNRGINATKPATVHIKHNDLWLQDEIVPPMPTETKYEFVRTIILYDIGNNLHVDITTDEPEYTDENNHWDNQIDLYFHLMAGHIYKHPILPDLFVPRAEFDPPMPLVSKELTMTVYQTNQGPGVATSTRLFIWLGNHAGGGQVGNVHTPYMMPNDTKSVTFAYNLTGFGSYNVGFTVDAVVRVPQSNRTNDNTNLRFFAYSHDQPVADWTAARAESHAMFITNTISRSDLPYRINSIWITHNGTHVFLRFAMSAPLDLIDQTLFLYINSDRDWSTGYGTTLGADYSVYNAIPQRFTGGADQDGWHWKMILDVPSELAAEGGDTSLIGFTLNATSIGIDLADDHAYAMFYMTLSDKEGMRDEYPRAGTFFTYPPSCFDGSLNQNEVGVDCGGVCVRECGRIVIDGRFDDWSAYPNKPLVANTSVTPEEGTLAPACRQVQSWLTFDADFLYLRIAFEGAIDRSVCNYYVLLSSPTRVGGYAASSGALNASVLVTNFASLAAFSGAVETEWAWTPQPNPVYNVIGSGAEANTIEIAIPRPALGWSSSDQTVSLVVQSVDTRNSLDWTSHVTQVMPQFGAVFQSETCFDLVYNNRETAVDCGGPECDACPPGITLDGYFADWPLATTVTKDRKQDGFVTVLDKQVATSIARCADLSMAATFSTTEWFYIMVRTWKGNPRDKQCVLEIAIDSDRNTKSGYPYKLGDVGADYRWVDGRMYQYIGNGKNWMWTELFNVTQIEYGKDPTFGMEIAISGQLLPRANTKAFIIYCDTRNTVAMADDGLDYWPEPNPKAPICGDFVRNGLETGVDCGAYCSPCATGVSLTDDTVVDWLQVPNPPVLAFEAEHQGDGFDASGKLHAISSSADIKWGHLSVNDTWVCVHLGLYGPYDVSVADYSMFFDTDGDAVTGYAASGGKVGAEWMWSSPGVVSQYTGAGSDWSWLVMEQEPSESLRSQVVDDDVEVCMTRRLIALPESRFNTSIALSFVAVDRVGSTNWRDHITDTFPTPGFAWRYSLDPQRPTSATATGAFMIPPDLSFKVLPLIIVAVLLFVSVLVAVVISYLYHVIKNAEPVTLPVRASSSRTTVPRAYSRLNEDYL